MSDTPNPESPKEGIPAAQYAPHGLKKDGTPRKPHTGGRNGGIGKFTPLRTKRIYDPEQLAEVTATALAQGKGLRASPLLGKVSDDDRLVLSRITGETVEVFNERIALKLRDIADLASLRIEQKLMNNEFKSGELGFILSVAHDKRLSLDGSRALNNASVNIQVNNFGTAPKDQLLGELDGLGLSKNVTPLFVDTMHSSPSTEKVS